MKMRKGFLLLFALLGLAGCRYLLPESPYFVVHEIELLFPEASERWAYFYGDPMAVSLEGETLVLQPPPEDERSPWAVPGALWVNGMPLWREVLPPVRPEVEARYDPFSGVFEIRTGTDLKSSWYYDGFEWYRLSGPVAAGRRVYVRPQPAQPRFENLTNGELRVIKNELVARGRGEPFLVFERARPVHPPYRFEPEPWVYLAASLRVQKEIVKVSQPLLDWRVLDTGSYAAYRGKEPYALLACSREALEELWDLAYGRKIPKPKPPELAPGRCLAGFFWGLKPSGGYRIEVRSGRRVGDRAEFVLELKTPPPGSLTTQALTSPFVLIELMGPVEEVRFYDLEGALLAQAYAR